MEIVKNSFWLEEIRPPPALLDYLSVFCQTKLPLYVSEKDFFQE